MAERIEALEAQVFGTFDEGAFASIFNLKKDLLAVRQVVADGMLINDTQLVTHRLEC